jgi:hypothetical protein
MKFQEIGFNWEWIASKTEDEFIKEAETNKHWFEKAKDREDLLKTVYALAKQLYPDEPVLPESSGKKE